MELQNILDSQSQICFQNETGRDSVVRTESGASGAHRIYDFTELFQCQGNGRFVCHKFVISPLKVRIYSSIFALCWKVNKK